MKNAQHAHLHERRQCLILEYM